MSSSVVCIGGFTLDWHENGASRHGPVPGGNALYSCVGAWLAGASPLVVADVGADYPPGLIEHIAAAGIGTQWLRHTGLDSDQVLLRNEDGLREIEFVKRPAERTVDFTGLRGSGPLAIHVCGMPIQSQEAALRACRSAGACSSLDLIRTSGDRLMSWSALVDLVAMSDVFLPSCQDLEGIMPVPTERLLDQLVEETGRPTVIRLGKEGSIGLAGGRFERLPAVPCVAVDATGAGDAYCGAFQTKWVETQDLRTAMAWGSAAASVVIEGLGATHALGLPHRLETARRAAAAAQVVAH